jgi:hypothetical protein
MFWLAQAKRGEPSLSLRILWFTSRAAARARPSSPRRLISHSSSALLFYVEARLLELPLPLPQLLELCGQWGLVPLSGPSLGLLGGVLGVFDTPFRDTRHGTHPRGVVASSAGTRVGDRLRFLHKEIMEGFRDVARHPMNSPFL